MYLHHSIHTDTLREIADSFNLELSMPVNQVSTQYADNSQESNLVLDLMFLHANVEEFNNYAISLDLQSLSYHAPLSVSIIIKEETIQDKKQAIVKNNKKEKEFINKLRNRIGCINTKIFTIVKCWKEQCKSLLLSQRSFDNITKHSKT